jgi:hypothetical protein
MEIIDKISHHYGHQEHKARNESLLAFRALGLKSIFVTFVFSSLFVGCGRFPDRTFSG